MNYCVKHNERCDSADASGHCSLTACNRYLLITDEAPTEERRMSDLIKKSDAIEVLNAVDVYGDGVGFEVLSHAIRDVSLLPTVDAEPVRHGKWIGGELGECSVCGHHGCASDIWNGCANQYCPNCGAKMDERNEECI